MKRRIRKIKDAAPVADFSQASLVDMCQGMQLIINEIQNRGYPIRDFDNKDRVVYGIKIIGGSVYILAAPEEQV